MYVLDEPSIGLHPRDNRRLVATLGRLRDLGNSVIVVEHDAETIESGSRAAAAGANRSRTVSNKVSSWNGAGRSPILPTSISERSSTFPTIPNRDWADWWA